jgi:AcrR family transcriptional regulator
MKQEPTPQPEEKPARRRKVSDTAEADTSAEQTRRALVLAGLKLFGAFGYDGASTRDIAAAANANIGSIAYHFGGKEGLRLAVADHIIELIQATAARAAAGFGPPSSPEQAETALLSMLETMIDFFVARPESADIVPFVLREMSMPTPAFERIYGGVFEPLHRRFCSIWALATGEPAESDETRLTVFTMIGQVLYFRLAREAVRRRMGWAGIGEPEAGAISAVASRNLKSVLKAHKDSMRKERGS